MKPALIATIIFLSLMIYGIYRVSSFKISDRKIKVGIVQPDLNPWDKWSTGNLGQSNRIIILIFQKNVLKKELKLILWPETALPVYTFGGAYHIVENSIFNFLDRNNVSLLTGMPILFIF